MARSDAPPAAVRRGGEGERRTGRHTLRDALIGVAVALVVAGGVVAGLSYRAYQQARQPVDAAQQFCADLEAQRYADAYGLLSSAYQARVPESQFVATAKLHDTVDGKVAGCSLPRVEFGLNLTLSAPTTADLAAQMTRGQQDFEGAISLVKQGDAWKVSDIAPALQGSDVGALAVGQAFCAALVAGDYHTAYAQLSPKKQAQASEKDFTNSFRSELSGDLKLTACTPDVTTYQVTGPLAKEQVTLQVAITTALGTQTVSMPVTLQYAQVSGAWKIDDFLVNIPNT